MILSGDTMHGRNREPRWNEARFLSRTQTRSYYVLKLSGERFEIR